MGLSMLPLIMRWKPKGILLGICSYKEKNLLKVENKEFIFVSDFNRNWLTTYQIKLVVVLFGDCFD